MLISWIVLAIGQLSASSSPLIDATTNTPRPTATPIAPGEPSTLVEALIGVVLIAGYLVLARRVRGRRGMQQISKSTRAGSGRKVA